MEKDGNNNNFDLSVLPVYLGGSTSGWILYVSSGVVTSPQVCHKKQELHVLF